MARATTIRFTDEVFARLDQASSWTGMPVNSIVVAACLEWMERHPPAGAAPDVMVRPTPTPRWSTIRRAVELAVAKRPTPGMYPFEAFSESAQRLLTRAQGEAQKSGFSYIGTEHLLLAALGDPESQATRILTSLGVTELELRTALDKLLTEHKHPKASFVVPTSRVKKVIELAFKLCQGASDPRVTTGHVLLALVIEGDGIAAHLMKDLGADRAAVESALEQAEPEA
jgi:hypothetical protein